MVDFSDAVAGAALLLITVLIVSTVAGSAVYLQNVTTTADWEDAESDSNDATFENDTLYLDSEGDYTSTDQDLENESDVEFQTESLEDNDNVDVAVYDASNDSELDSSTLEGEDSFEFDVSDDVDEYYVEYETGTDETAEVDFFRTTNEGDFQDHFQLLVIGVIGIGILYIFKTLG